MSASNRIVLPTARPAEVAVYLKDLDPDTAYEVVIRPVRSRQQVLQEMEALTRDIARRASLEGLTEEKFAEILDLSEEERRNLFG